MSRRREKEGTDKELVQEMIRCPGWLVLERKAKIVLENADSRFHGADRNSFDEAKGFYRGAKLFHDMIVKDPLEIANLQGIVKLGKE